MNFLKQDEYERFAPYYRKIGLMRNHFVEQTRFVEKIIDDFPSQTNILDAACGTGDVLNNLATTFPDMSFFGSDNSRALLSYSKQLYNYSKISFKQTSWLKLPNYYESNFFSIIFILGNSILHVKTLNELQITLKIIGNLLKKGGLFIFDVRDWQANIANNHFNQPLGSQHQTLSFKLNSTEYLYNTKLYQEQERYKLVHSLTDVTQNNKVVVTLTFLKLSINTIINCLNKEKFHVLSSKSPDDDYSYFHFVAEKL